MSSFSRATHHRSKTHPQITWSPTCYASCLIHHQSWLNTMASTYPKVFQQLRVIPLIELNSATYKPCQLGTMLGSIKSKSSMTLSKCSTIFLVVQSTTPLFTLTPDKPQASSLNVWVQHMHNFYVLSKLHLDPKLLREYTNQTNT